MNKLNIEDICKVLEDEQYRRLVAKADAERRAREEAARKKREEEERARKAREEAERKRRDEEERARLAREAAERKRRAEEAQRRADEERARKAAQEAKIKAFKQSVSRFKLFRGLGYLFWMASVCGICFSGSGAMSAGKESDAGALAFVLFIFLCLHLNIVTKALKANGGMLGNEKEVALAKSMWHASFFGAAGFPLMVLACDQPAMVFAAALTSALLQFFIRRKKINFNYKLSQTDMKYVKIISYIPLIVGIIAIFC